MKPNSRQLEVIRSLREERKKQNLSMLTLARKLGHKSNGSVWAFEHGRDYSDKFANRLAEALGVKIDLAPKSRASMAPAPLTPQDRIRIGDMIKAKREELKLSRADVSRLADLPGFVIASIENKTNSYGRERAAVVGTALGLSDVALFEAPKKTLMEVISPFVPPALSLLPQPIPALNPFFIQQGRSTDPEPKADPRLIDLAADLLKRVSEVSTDKARKSLTLALSALDL